MKTGIKPNSAPHKKQQRAWTEQEIELLSERYYFEGASAALMQDLNCVNNTIWRKAKELGLRRTNYDYQKHKRTNH